MVEILGIPVHLYGLMIGLGVLMGGWVSAKVAKREKVSPDLVWDGLVWVMILGVVGARAYHVVDYWAYYSGHMVEMVKVWRGGLGIYGGIFGGVVGAVLFAKRHQISNFKFLISKRAPSTEVDNDQKMADVSLSKMLDVASFGVPVGQAIGRWGNYFNQELFGVPTDWPWGVYIRPENRPAGMERFSHFQPLFLYESMLSLGLFVILVVSYRRFIWQARDKQEEGWRIGEGKYLGMYLVGYGLIRMVLEPLRLRSWNAWGIPVAEWVSMGIMGLGIYLMFRKKRLTKTSGRQ